MTISRLCCSPLVAVLFFFCAITTSDASSFLPSWIHGADSVASPAEVLVGQYACRIDTVVNARFNVGLVSDQLFAIDGFQFQLCNDPLLSCTTSNNNAAAARLFVPLPGANGPRPKLSSGPHRIDVTNNGSFINLNGIQSVQLTHGAWELIWRDESPAGLLICGFHLDHDAIRNDHILPKGNLYLTFPVWSNDGLKEKHVMKQIAEVKYKEYESERNEQLVKLKETSNLFQKAMHFRQAAKAVESMDNTGLHLLTNLPLNHELLDIGGTNDEDGGEGLLKMVKTGTLWSKTGSFRSSDRQKLIGTVSIH